MNTFQPKVKTRFFGQRHLQRRNNKTYVVAVEFSVISANLQVAVWLWVATHVVAFVAINFAANHVAFRGHVMNSSPPMALDNKITNNIYDS